MYRTVKKRVENNNNYNTDDNFYCFKFITVKFLCLLIIDHVRVA